ncbi:MAG: hypothetical protein JXA71_14570, partial [Chitinispirillaceae bacterium]|nr:hypothetical protein [Chitinispirillaceae bacterium]
MALPQAFDVTTLILLPAGHPMRLLFTEDDPFVHHRSRAFRGGLLRNFHRVSVKRELSGFPRADLWFHGLSHDPAIPFRDPVRRAMETFPGRLAFFQNDDHLGFSLEKIPRALRDRASLFLRNVWPSDPGRIDTEIRDRTGLLNPLLKPLPARPGKPLTSRMAQALFFGAATGGTSHSRIDAIRMLKALRVPFLGGIVRSPHTQDPPPDLAAAPLDARGHSRALSESAICLALHGNCPLTYRLFEGFSRRCLVVAQSLASIRFADCGLLPGVHYVEVREDL